MSVVHCGHHRRIGNHSFATAVLCLMPLCVLLIGVMLFRVQSSTVSGTLPKLLTLSLSLGVTKHKELRGLTIFSISQGPCTACPTCPATSDVQDQNFLNSAVIHENKKLSNNSNIYYLVFFTLSRRFPSCIKAESLKL